MHILGFGVLSIALQVFIPYTRYVNYLKWLSLSLFAYVVTAFRIHVPWGEALRALILPPLHGFRRDYTMMVVAVLGTTISPYLFFWQASQEAEEVQDKKEDKSLREDPSKAPDQLRRIKFDTYSGMAASNLVAFFIMLTSAATLHAHGQTNIQTATEAAQALEPFAGRFAYILFAAGIIGTGLLTVPVLAGTAAYAIGEMMQWRVGLENKPKRALKFYATLGAATIAGLSLNFVHLDPIKALLIAAVINGILAAPVMALMMLLTQNRRVMGQFTLPLYLRVFGWIGTLAMCAASVAFFAGVF